VSGSEPIGRRAEGTPSQVGVHGAGDRSHDRDAKVIKFLRVLVLNMWSCYCRRCRVLSVSISARVAFEILENR
jgi:hypothetical protein